MQHTKFDSIFSRRVSNKQTDKFPMLVYCTLLMASVAMRVLESITVLAYSVFGFWKESVFDANLAMNRQFKNAATGW